MAWQKVMTRIHWENEPSTATPIDENNLNMGDNAIDVIDDRVIELDNRTGNLEGYESRVAELEGQARESKEAAALSEQNAKTSEANAKASETEANGWKEMSESWAVGTPDGKRPDEKVNNSKYYAEMAQQAAAAAGYMGFEIKEDGHLYYGKTDGIKDKVDFAIIANGHLEARIYG